MFLQVFIVHHEQHHQQGGQSEPLALLTGDSESADVEISHLI